MEMPTQSASRGSDVDSCPKKTGTFWTTSAHISSAMVGTVLLSVAWDIAHLGWIAGPVAMCLISFLCYCTSWLLCDCCDSASPDRNCTYADFVRSILGMEFHYCVVASHYFGSRTLIKLPINFCIQMYSKKSRITFNYVIIGTLDSQNTSIFRVIFSGGVKAKACAFIQYLTLFGMVIELTVTASVSMMAIKYTNCSHDSNGEECYILSNPYAIIFGITEILLSQIPDFDGIWWVSIVSVVMFFTNALIGLGLAIARVAAGGSDESNEAVTGTQKIWTSFQALGDIAFAYSFSEVLIEIQDTLSESESESESKRNTMKKATLWSTVVMTTLFMLWGCVGYASLGDATPRDLTDFASYGPFWLLYIANTASLINLVGRYQIFSQPIFAFVEEQAANRWPRTRDREISLPGLGHYKMNLFSLVWRTVFVILTTVISMTFPPFNDVVEIITLGFWPLAVYFPVEMYIKLKKIDRWSPKWVCLQMLSMACLAISIMATVGSIAGLKDYLKDYRPFRMSYI